MAAQVSQQELVKKLVDAGVHFGHPVSRWNPRMEPYIYGKRGNVHLIDIKETVKGLLRAKQLLKKFVADGKDVLFVGTKRQARDPVAREAERCGMHFVTERWLGGTLTNFRTIRSRLQRLDELDALWESGEIDAYSKKMKATLGRERRKINSNLSGIRHMEKMPGVIFLVDVKREKIAVQEARKLGIPTVALIDTDGNPELIDLPVPGNDDAMRAIDAIMVELADAVLEGKKSRPEPKDGGADAARREQRRSARSRFRGDEGDDRPSFDRSATDKITPIGGAAPATIGNNPKQPTSPESSETTPGGGAGQTGPTPTGDADPVDAATLAGAPEATGEVPQTDSAEVVEPGSEGLQSDLPQEPLDAAAKAAEANK